jgi:hypothetical protein
MACALRGWRSHCHRTIQDFAATGCESMFRAMLCGLFAESDDFEKIPKPEDAIIRR